MEEGYLSFHLRLSRESQLDYKGGYPSLYDKVVCFLTINDNVVNGKGA